MLKNQYKVPTYFHDKSQLAIEPYFESGTLAVHASHICQKIALQK